ncbi:selenide, water dikinase SelD [Psychromonas sp. MB-3u-54]|uniref:selenide, water dikinase SelD n=1 Tax=Psychromonas sp. MB-3u-54 TaxID=2058319 RepID=UPI000C32076D|nr:selenide, water dikinase SelD [Psychromonas sp. MB-3u-54]PKH01559.1 selenide, water dikinase SelD [Psychromonas sp. MB-3u-54]
MSADYEHTNVRLTQYSHGAGCGCKISPKVLDSILLSALPAFQDPNLLVGNENKDDAAVYDLGNGSSIISTTDFFMPIVDDPFDFGRIAATNAISDIYAMGGKPIMAIAILGWPVNKLDPSIAARVIDGGRSVCHAAGIALAGGHSIDAPEPIFGLAVTGIVPTDKIKQNSQAKEGDLLFLSKPIGIGILTTAEKKGLLKAAHKNLARDTMCELNQIGAEFANIDGVNAMTDVTGFGLLGHLSEICEGSGLSASLDFSAIPTLDAIEYYVEKGCVPGGSMRNFDSYGHKVSPISELQKTILCDPQTSGGLLISVSPSSAEILMETAKNSGVKLFQIGKIESASAQQTVISVL